MTDKFVGKNYVTKENFNEFIKKYLEEYGPSQIKMTLMEPNKNFATSTLQYTYDIVFPQKNMMKVNVEFFGNYVSLLHKEQMLDPTKEWMTCEDLMDLFI